MNERVVTYLKTVDAFMRIKTYGCLPLRILASLDEDVVRDSIDSGFLSEIPGNEDCREPGVVLTPKGRRLLQTTASHH